MGIGEEERSRLTEACAGTFASTRWVAVGRSAAAGL